MYEKSSAPANGEGLSDSTRVKRISPRLILLRIPAAAGKSNTSRIHSRYVSRIMGNEEKREATANKSAARLRCCHNGARMPGRRLGNNSAREAASRNLAANKEVDPSWRRTNSLNSAGDNTKSSVSTGASLSGRRKTKPSSDHMDSTSSPRSARSLAVTAMHHGA